MSKKKNTFIKVCAIVAVCLALFAAIASIAHCAANGTETLGGGDYKVASLTVDGKVVESEANIITRNFINVDELTVTYSDDAEYVNTEAEEGNPDTSVKVPVISYQIYWYDENEEFISSTEVLTDDFDGPAPEGAEFAKILIIHSEDTEITFFEKYDYVKQIEVTHAR